jgi:hypothetical protein
MQGFVNTYNGTKFDASKKNDKLSFYLFNRKIFHS